MPLKEIQCGDCGHVWETILGIGEPPEPCVHCESTRVVTLPSSFGGYKIKGDNSASVRPKGAGSRAKGSK